MKTLKMDALLIPYMVSGVVSCDHWVSIRAWVDKKWEWSKFDMSAVFSSAPLLVFFDTLDTERIQQMLRGGKVVWLVDEEPEKVAEVFALPVLDFSEAIEKFYGAVVGKKVKADNVWSLWSSPIRATGNVDLGWLRQIIAIMDGFTSQSGTRKYYPSMVPYFEVFRGRLSVVRPLVYFWFVYVTFNPTPQAVYLAFSHIFTFVGVCDVNLVYSQLVG